MLIYHLLSPFCLSLGFPESRIEGKRLCHSFIREYNPRKAGVRERGKVKEEGKEMQVIYTASWIILSSVTIFQQAVSQNNRSKGRKEEKFTHWVTSLTEQRFSPLTLAPLYLWFAHAWGPSGSCSLTLQ